MVVGSDLLSEKGRSDLVGELPKVCIFSLISYRFAYEESRGLKLAKSLPEVQWWIGCLSI